MAVLFTDKKIARGILTAFSWMVNSKIKSFLIKDLEKGLKWAGIEPSKFNSIKETFKELRISLEQD